MLLIAAALIFCSQIAVAQATSLVIYVIEKDKEIKQIEDYFPGYCSPEEVHVACLVPTLVSATLVWPRASP